MLQLSLYGLNPFENRIAYLLGLVYVLHVSNATNTGQAGPPYPCGHLLVQAQGTSHAIP